jgi:hypothetical protein
MNCTRFEDARAIIKPRRHSNDLFDPLQGSQYLSIEGPSFQAGPVDVFSPRVTRSSLIPDPDMALMDLLGSPSIHQQGSPSVTC